ncbi:MAG: DUF3147 family protein [Gammaproteobacteria bacterium]|nr:DUF3147 family protein [Gammaproteobacteria bacterium]
MIYYIAKISTTLVLIIAIAEISKRSTFLGAVLASLPLVSVLAMVWLYVDTRDVQKVAALSSSIFWLVIPSLTLFLVLSVMLKKGINFYISMGTGLVTTLVCYLILIEILGKTGIRL